MHPRFRILLSAVLLAAAFFAAPALCLLGAVPAQAQDALYTVPGVHVDAGGASSTEALNAAITQGRGQAFQVLFRRLTRQVDWSRQPALDGAALLRISRGFTIANERRSTTRYVADVTFMLFFCPRSLCCLYCWRHSKAFNQLQHSIEFFVHSLNLTL